MILAELEAKDYLAAAGVSVLPVRSVPSWEAVRAEAKGLGYPVVLKLSSALHTHKTEVGGVVLDIRDAGRLEEAYRRLAELRERVDPLASIIIEPMAAPGAELFIGVQRHPAFGPLVSLGLGGVWLELIEDVTFRLLPATRGDLEEMLGELRSWPKLCAGFRHLPPVGREPLLALLERISALVSARPEILELDLNPVLVHSDRAEVVDARIVLE